MPLRYFGQNVYTDGKTVVRAGSFLGYATIFSIAFLALSFFLAITRCVLWQLCGCRVTLLDSPTVEGLGVYCSVVALNRSSQELQEILAGKCCIFIYLLIVTSAQLRSLCCSVCH